MGSSRNIHDVTTLQKQTWFPELQKMLADPAIPYGQIAKRFGISTNLITAYSRYVLQKNYAALRDAKQEDDASVYASRLEELQTYCNKVIAACDEWLRDPDDPEKYTLDPRYDELRVVYMVSEESDDGRIRKVKKSADLSYLLDELRRYGRIEPQTVSYKSADPRKLMLEALGLARENIKTISEVLGVIKDIRMTVDVQGSLIPNLTNLILDATVDAPIVRERIISKIEILASELRTGEDYSSIREEQR